MSIKKIPIDSIKNYSFEFLRNEKYANQTYSFPLNKISNLELLKIFKRGSFRTILLKVLSKELEVGLQVPPKTNLDIEYNNLLIEIVKELLLFMTNEKNSNGINVDTFSYKRILNFISKNENYLSYHIPIYVISTFKKLNMTENIWTNEDSKFINICIEDDCSSSYNAGKIKFLKILDNLEKGIFLKLDEQTIKSTEEFYNWMQKDYAVFVDMVKNTERIIIVES